MLNPHAFAGEIKRHPEVEALPVTRDNRAEVMKDVLDRPTERLICLSLDPLVIARPDTPGRSNLLPLNLLAPYRPARACRAGDSSRPAGEGLR